MISDVKSYMLGALIGLTAGFILGDNGKTPSSLYRKDFDNDGYTDYLIKTNYGHKYLFLNQKDGTFRLATNKEKNDCNLEYSELNLR